MQSTIEKPQKRTHDEIPIVFVSDNNYAPVLGGGGINSLIQNASKDRQYSIYILYADLSEENKRKLKSLECDNVKIFFTDVNKYIESIDRNLFYLHHHFSESSYYRIFIPKIFSNYEKILYFDCDGIFMSDVAELYDIDLKDKLLGAVQDTAFGLTLEEKKQNKYLTKTVKMKNPDNYVNTGVLSMNIPKLNEFDFTNKCIQLLPRTKNMQYVDQDIINLAMEDKILFISREWNCYGNLLNTEYNPDLEKTPKLYDIIKEIKSPKFLHFAGWAKPWSDTSIANGEIFWQYARKSPFYETIIYDFVHKTIGANKKFYSSTIERIFSVKNLKKANICYRVITIMGVQIKFLKRR